MLEYFCLILKTTSWISCLLLNVIVDSAIFCYFMESSFSLVKHNLVLNQPCFSECEIGAKIHCKWLMILCQYIVYIYLNSHSGLWKHHLNVNFTFISKYCASSKHGCRFFLFGPTYVTAIQYKNRINSIRFVGKIMHIFEQREKKFFPIHVFLDLILLCEPSWTGTKFMNLCCCVFGARCFEVYIFCPLSAVCVSQCLSKQSCVSVAFKSWSQILFIWILNMNRFSFPLLLLLLLAVIIINMNSMNVGIVARTECEFKASTTMQTLGLCSSLNIY